jgi:hypothetical protein
MIPSKIEIDDHIFVPGEGFKIDVPGHPDWIFTTQHKGHFISEGWLKNGKLVHTNIFNAIDNQRHPMLIADNVEVNELSSHSGYGWTDNQWLESQATVESTPWDAKFDTWNDPDITRNTGSSNMSFFSPPEILAKRYGVSPAILRFYDRYAIKQIRRPRWWLNIFGLPVNLEEPNSQLSTFGEWDENSQGLNAYDVQHLDGYELYSGYKFTHDPSYLFSLMNLWLHASSNNWYLRYADDQIYGGSQRTLGWSLVLSCQLYELISVIPQFEDLADRIRNFIVWHVGNGIRKFPIASPWFSGSVPSIFKIHQKNYVFGWQYAVAAHGYMTVSETFQESHPLLATKAYNHARQILTYITSHCDEGPDPITQNGWIGYIWAVDETPGFLIKNSPPGVSDWYLAPLMRFDEFPVKESLIQKLVESGWTNESHRYYTYALNVMGDSI